MTQFRMQLLILWAAITFVASPLAATEAEKKDNVPSYWPSYPTYVDLESEHRPVISLNGRWQFQTDPQELGIPQQWYQSGKSFSGKIEVPGAWQAQGVGQPTPYLKTQYLGTAWYKRCFHVVRKWPDQQVRLKIGGANPSFDVWVNGQSVGYSRQPGLPCRFDITKVVQYDQVNNITIRVHETNRGLGNWYNLNASWSGLWRSVSVELTRSVWIENVFIVPDLDRSAATVHFDCVAANGNARKKIVAKVRVHDAQKQVAGTASREIKLTGKKQTVSMEVPIEDVCPWSPNDPHLYRLGLQLTENDEIIDAVGERFGMRKIAVKGRQILLNDEPIYLRGVGDDGMYPNRLCPETDRRTLRQHMQLIKDCGFNYVYPCLIMQPEEYLDAADEVGLMIQYDAAAVLAFQRNGPGRLPTCTRKERNRLILQQWEALLRWTQNHPSIIIYSPGSELAHEPILDKMYEVAGKKDASRLVLNWTGDKQTTDVMDVGDLAATLDPGEQLHKTIAGWKGPVPGLIHEYIGAETMPDPRLIEKFKTGLQPIYEKQVQQAVEKLGISELIGQLVENSQHIAAACRKFELEEARKVTDPTGYNMWLIQDIHICPQGIFDPFWQGQSVRPETIAQSAGDTILMMQEKSLRTVRCFWAEQKAGLEIWISHFGSKRIEGATLHWALQAHSGNKTLLTGKKCGIDVERFYAGKICDLVLDIPKLGEATTGKLKVSLGDAHTEIENEWKLWLLPKEKPISFDLKIGLYSTAEKLSLKGIAERYPRTTLWTGQKVDILIADSVDKNVADYVARGGDLLLLVMNNDRLIKTQFMPRWPLSGIVNNSATLINDHPCLDGWPQEGFCDYQFYHLIGRTIPSPQWPTYNRGRSEAFNLDLFSSKVPPIIRVFHTQANCAYLFEAKVGQGRLLASTFNFVETVGEFAEADYLFNELLLYMNGHHFEPESALGEQDLLLLTDNAE